MLLKITQLASSTSSHKVLLPPRPLTLPLPLLRRRRLKLLMLRLKRHTYFLLISAISTYFYLFLLIFYLLLLIFTYFLLISTYFLWFSLWFSVVFLSGFLICLWFSTFKIGCFMFYCHCLSCFGVCMCGSFGFVLKRPTGRSVLSSCFLPCECCICAHCAEKQVLSLSICAILVSVLVLVSPAW